MLPLGTQRQNAKFKFRKETSIQSDFALTGCCERRSEDKVNEEMCVLSQQRTQYSSFGVEILLEGKVSKHFFELNFINHLY